MVGGVFNRSGQDLGIVSGRQSSGGTNPPKPGVPKWGGPPGWGCSSYQRLSKFAGIWGTPILKSGLRGTAKKLPKGGFAMKHPKKGSKMLVF